MTRILLGAALLWIALSLEVQAAGAFMAPRVSVLTPRMPAFL